MRSVGRIGWALVWLLAGLGTLLVLFPRTGGATKAAPPPPGSVVYPSLTVPPEVIANSPIAERCYKCHGQDKEAYEWAQSGHANNLATLRAAPNAANSCLSCHSSGYRLRPALGWEQTVRRAPRITLGTAINEVSCSSCHSHAREDAEDYLIQPEESLCISCHKMDCGCAGKGVIHQSQAEMFRGVEGRGVTALPSKHFSLMLGRCSSCHMYRPPDAEEKVLTEGGHTFKAPLSACVSCHQDVSGLMAQRRAEVEVLLQKAEALLAAVDPQLRTVQPYQDAKLNVDLVHGDSGWGLHNPTYAKALLEAAIKMLKPLANRP